MTTEREVITIPSFQETLIGMTSRVQQIVPVTQPKPEHLQELSKYFGGILRDVYSNAWLAGKKEGERIGYDVGYAKSVSDHQKEVAQPDPAQPGVGG